MFLPIYNIAGNFVSKDMRFNSLYIDWIHWLARKVTCSDSLADVRAWNYGLYRFSFLYQIIYHVILCFCIFLVLFVIFLIVFILSKILKDKEPLQTLNKVVSSIVFFNFFTRYINLILMDLLISIGINVMSFFNVEYLPRLGRNLGEANVMTVVGAIIAVPILSLIAFGVVMAIVFSFLKKNKLWLNYRFADIFGGMRMKHHLYPWGYWMYYIGTRVAICILVMLGTDVPALWVGLGYLVVVSFSLFFNIFHRLFYSWPVYITVILFECCTFLFAVSMSLNWVEQFTTPDLIGDTAIRNW